MTAVRVDKTWQARGLATFSTEAILGTLRHYGVAVDEAGFRTAAAVKYPHGIAEEWLKAWAGKGQFARFPFFAAEELWTRLEKGRTTPSELTQAVAALAKALRELRDDQPDAPVGATLARANELVAQAPRSNGVLDEAFSSEVELHLRDSVAELNQLALGLVEDGHVEDADDLVAIEEAVLPVLGGTARAMVRAAKGEKAEASADLEAIAQKPEAKPETRLAALEGLLAMGASEKAHAQGVRLLDDAEARGDLHFALAVGERLVHAGEHLGPEAQAKAMARLQRLTELHHAAHPHHAHRR